MENELLNIICQVLNCTQKDITNIKTMKKGMTNLSYIFSIKEQKYIIRIPGEGTDKLINRKEEAEVYKQIEGKEICDKLYYINPDTGIKISQYIENSRCCDAFNEHDLKICMNKLREFHNMKLKTNHEFNIYEKIDFYESLWTKHSIFEDYEQTKRNTLSLKKYIDFCKPEYSLTHIDAICDNFLFSNNGDGSEKLQLIDWEYSGMQDQHVDIAMFCIYSIYERNQIDRLIDIYFEDNCSQQNRIKIYCYISLCGLLWSNWCDYKRQLGIEFGEYHKAQYDFAKNYYTIAIEEIKKLGVTL